MYSCLNNFIDYPIVFLIFSAHDWNLHSALSAYYVMKGILPGEVPLSDSEISVAAKKNTQVFPKNACENTKLENFTRPPLKKLAAFDLDDGGTLFYIYIKHLIQNALFFYNI